MSKEEIIRPELFEVKHEYGYTYYVIAYDMIHALQSMPGHSEKSLEIKQLTGDTISFTNTLHIAKECLPQGFVNKEITQK